MTDGLTAADVAAVTGGNSGFGLGGDGAWWIIILFLFAFSKKCFSDYSLKLTVLFNWFLSS